MRVCRPALKRLQDYYRDRTFWSLVAGETMSRMQIARQCAATVAFAVSIPLDLCCTLASKIRTEEHFAIRDCCICNTGLVLHLASKVGTEERFVLRF